MTSDDTNSTSGATLPAHPRETTAPETMLAAVLAGNVEAARAYGFDVDALCREANLTPIELADLDGRVAVEKYVRFWEALCALSRATDFGLWLGESMRSEALGVVGYVMQEAPDLRRAFQALGRFGKLIGDQLSPSIDEGPESVVFHRVEPPRLARLAGLLVAAPLATLTLMRDLAGLSRSQLSPSEVAFPHARPSAPVEARYREAFGCTVVFQAPELRLVVPRRIFDLPTVSPNRGLYDYLTQHASALQARLRETQALSARVRELVLARLSEGEPEQAVIAQRLGMSDRTLQRRLKAEHTSFALLVDELRRELADTYLADPNLAVYQVAFLLGYSEPSAFNRAYKRWTQQNPSEARERLRRTSPRG